MRGNATIASRTRGFTLIEVLIAFVIMALVLGVVFRSFSAGLGHERAAQAATARVLAARSLMDRVGADIALEPGETAGEIAGVGTWVLTVSPADPEAYAEGTRPGGGLNAYLAQLTITGTDGRDFDLATVKLGR